MTDQELTAIVAAVKTEVRRSLSPWLTEAEAADYLRVSPDWIREHRKELGARVIPGKRGRSWRYHRESIDRALMSPWMGGSNADRR